MKSVKCRAMGQSHIVILKSSLGTEIYIMESKCWSSCLFRIARKWQMCKLEMARPVHKERSNVIWKAGCDKKTCSKPNH